MYTCPICNKIKDNAMDLAKHIIMPSRNEILNQQHKDWIESHNLDLSKGFKSLAEFLHEKCKRESSESFH